MKGEERVINQLNELLADELTAINQYMVHSEMCDNWGYERLHKSIEERAIQEMKHAEALIARILYFEGTPIVSTLNKINIGQVVEAQIKNDLAGEISAAEMYNNGILLVC
jgi:bacterioferritin